MDKRRSKDANKHGLQFKEKKRVESTPSTTLPPSNAPSWTIEKSYMDSQTYQPDSETSTSTMQGSLTDVSTQPTITTPTMQGLSQQQTYTTFTMQGLPDSGTRNQQQGTPVRTAEWSSPLTRNASRSLSRTPQQQPLSTHSSRIIAQQKQPSIEKATPNQSPLTRAQPLSVRGSTMTSQLNLQQTQASQPKPLNPRVLSLQVVDEIVNTDYDSSESCSEDDDFGL